MRGRENTLSAPFIAGAALTLNRMVKITTGGEVIHPAAIDEQTIGVTLDSATAAEATANKVVQVQVLGVAKIEASAAIAAGVLVAVSGSDGRIATATPANTTTATAFHFAVGIALEAAGGAAEVISVLLASPVAPYVNTTDATI